MSKTLKKFTAYRLVGKAVEVVVVDVDAQRDEGDKKDEETCEDPAFKTSVANIIRHRASSCS